MISHFECVVNVRLIYYKINKIYIVFHFRYNLGKVLESLGEFDTASDCMATAQEVEISNPILPFSSIPLTFD
jgi:hypothetical protein